MEYTNADFNRFLDLVNFYKSNRFLFNPRIQESPEDIGYYKKGNKIKIKKENRGKFTEYCGGNVTSECISRGKHSSDPKIRKRATFAANSRSWKHEEGGRISLRNNRLTNFNNLFNN